MKSMKATVGPLTAIIAGLAAIAGGGGCATESSVADDYHHAIQIEGARNPSPPPAQPNIASGKLSPVGSSASTTVVILVDGLGLPLLKSELQERRLPAIASYFAHPSGNLRRSRFSLFRRREPVFTLGRASFPTLTYPNIISILTGRPLSGHLVNGNRLVSDDGRITNFESFLEWPSLDRNLSEMTVFANLRDRGLTSVSFSYPFSFASTAQQRATIDAAMKYASKDYASVDEATLRSFGKLLETTPYEAWPRFVFVHLISVDGFAHDLGPDSEEAANALRLLDHGLNPIFELIRQAESRGHRTETVLTADHGFAPTRNKIPIEAITSRLKSGVRVVADNRIASFHLPSEWSELQRGEAAAGFLSIEHMNFAAVRQGLYDGFTNRSSGPRAIDLFFADGRSGKIELQAAPCESGMWAARFKWRSGEAKSEGKIENPTAVGGFLCPEEFDRASMPGNQSFIVSSLVEYFTMPGAPDLVVLPDASSDFAGGYKGNHGGLTEAEVFVPILTRNITIEVPILATHRLLHRLGLFTNEAPQNMKSVSSEQVAPSADTFHSSSKDGAK